MKELNKTATTIEEKLKKENVIKFAYTITDNKKEEFTAQNGEFSLLRTVFSSIFSLTVFLDKRVGTKIGNDLTEEGIEKTIKEAIDAASSSDKDSAYDIAEKEDDIKLDRGDTDLSNELFFSRIKELLLTVKENYPLVHIMDTVGEHIHYNSLYKNSNGTTEETTGGSFSFYIGFSAHDNGEGTGMNYSGFTTKKLDKPFIELGSIKSDLESSVNSLQKAFVKEKFTGDLIFTPSCFGNFVSFLLEDISNRSILNGTSIWKDKIGSVVADEKLTITLKSSDERIVDGELITSDGFKTEDVPIIENGILKNLIINLYTANKTGRKPTKNTSSDLVITPGDSQLEDMIEGTEKGLIIGGFSGGQPSINGDFSGVAKNSFLIENGKIVGAVSETMVNGNLIEMVKEIRAISKEYITDGSAVIPYVAVRGIVISSK